MTTIIMKIIIYDLLIKYWNPKMNILKKVIRYVLNKLTLKNIELKKNIKINYCYSFKWMVLPSTYIFFLN